MNRIIKLGGMVCGAAAFAISTLSASAQISVVNTASGLFASDSSGNFSISYTAMNPNDVLVVGFYTDAGGSALSSLGFGTGTGDQAPGAMLSQARSTLAYFVNPSTSSGLTLNGVTGNAGAVANCGYYIWELSDVNLSAPVASTIGTDNTTTITTTAANSFITDIAGFNPYGSLTSFTPDATDSILTNPVLVDVNSGIGGGWLGVATATPASAGVQPLGWDVNVPAGYGDFREMAFGFIPVPEPSSLAMLGSGLLGLLMIYRVKRS